MNTSENINELATALAKAQGEITGALKDSANPFFKSKYADLASCWDACRTALSKNQIAVIQVPEWHSDDHSQGLGLTTTLVHSSGQWMRGTLRCNPKDNTDQATGSSITYARRYALAAMVGIAQVDDDGNAASGRHPNQAYEAPHKPQGDVSHVNPDTALKAAVNMREILEMDIADDIKALKVLDKHDVLAKDSDLYIAASAELSAAERKNWKAYVAEAKEREKEDRKVSNVGKRW